MTAIPTTFLFLMTLLGTVTRAVAQTWAPVNEDNAYTARHECSFVQAGDKFYLMGGRENSRTVDVYNYTTDSWEALVNSAPASFNHFQATEYQGLIWVIGAFGDNGFPNEMPEERIWIFNPTTESWIQGPLIPEDRRRGSTGLSVYNDKFYISGGNTIGHNGGFVPWFDSYDPLTGEWTVLADLPRSRDHFHSAVVGNNLYLAGGRLSGGVGGVFAPTIPEVDVYNFTTATWSTLPANQNIPTPRGAATAVNYDDQLLIIGGEVQNEDVYGVNTDDALKITEAYDPGSQTWERLSDLNFERHGTQAIVSGPGVFILAGSPARGGGNQQNMEFYGTNAPVGEASEAGILNAPESVLFENIGPQSFNLELNGGNVAAFIRSMTITGPDAADFTLTSGALENGLILPDSSRPLEITLSGSGENRNAVLNIAYGASSTLNILLSTSGDGGLEVTNPGDQYHVEGDIVSLGIDAAGTGNLIYSATGLPPNLSINPNTGVIGGTISDGSGSGGAYMESSGVVVIEAESGPIVPNWSITNVGGTAGIVPGTDSFINQNGGTIPYQIEISTPGVYRFNWNTLFSGSDATEENDNWLRLPNNNDVWFFGFKGAVADEATLINNLQGSQTNIVFPKGSSRVTPATDPDGNGSNGYFKIYRSGGSPETYSWQARTSDNDPHDVYVWFVNPGTYTLELSERSIGHAIDRLALYKVNGPNYNGSQLSALPPSSISGGGAGAADDSPYQVTVSVTDGAAIPDSESVQFIWNIAETLQLTAIPRATPLNGDAPLEVNFTGSESVDDVAVTSYLWDFGDGTPTDATADPVHIFTEPGEYIVTLTVGDVDGNTDSNTLSFTVTEPPNEPPVAQITASLIAGDTPLLVNFTGSSSTDDTGIVSYVWDFMDGGGSQDPDPEHTFVTEGVYIVQLTVTDAGGLSDTSTIEITVSTAPDLPPVAFAEANPITGIAPLEVQFTGSNSTDDLGIVTYAWEFMDLGATASEADPSYIFTTPGQYEVQLTVTDISGQIHSDTVLITVTADEEDLPPVAVAEADPVSGEAPLTVQFTGSNSYDDSEITGYLWDFQDGSTSMDINPIHVFEAEGTYNVTLTVTDDTGNTGIATLSVTVGEVENEAPVAVIEVSATSGEAPLEINFTGSQSLDDTELDQFFWQFGNGDTSQEADPVYTYQTPGEYTVVLTVTDAGGLTSIATVTISVTETAGPFSAVILQNPAAMGDAAVRLLQLPGEVVPQNIYLHDSSGRLIASYQAETQETDPNVFEIPVNTLRDGLYFISLEFNTGDPVRLKLLIKN